MALIVVGVRPPAPQYGGGMGNTGTATLLNVTITNNTAGVVRRRPSVRRAAAAHSTLPTRRAPRQPEMPSSGC